MNLTFSKAEVARLLANSMGATARAPTIDQLHDKRYWVNAEGPAELNNIDQARVPAGLILVSDRGIFLASNISTDEQFPTPIAYAHEGNPRDEAMWDTKARLLNGDDFTHFIPMLKILQWTAETTSDTLTLSIINNRITLHTSSEH